MRFTKEGRDTVEKVHLISGEPREKVKSVLESLFTLFILNYLNKEASCIPFLGDIHIKYEGDKVVGNGVKAVLSMEFNPDKSLIDIIGQIEDGEETDIERFFMKKISVDLLKFIED